MKKLILVSLSLIVLVITGCKAKPEPGSVVEEYLKTKSWEDKQQFILDSKGFKEEPEIFKHDCSFNKISEIKNKENGYCIVTAVMKSGKGEETDDQFFVKKIGETYKIDLKATIGFSGISLRAFTIQKPDSAEFRVMARFDRDYPRTPYSMIIVQNSYSDPYMEYTFVVDRTQPYSKKLIELLSDGKNHPVILKVKPLHNDFYRGVVTDFIKEGWIL